MKKLFFSSCVVLKAIDLALLLGAALVLVAALMIGVVFGTLLGWWL